MNHVAPDFLRGPARPYAGWVCLGVGTLAIVAALAWDYHEAQGREAALRAQRQAQEAAGSTTAPAPSPAERAAQQRVRQVQAELRMPWLAVLQAVEAATVKPVYMLSMSVEPSSGAVRLDAEATNYEQALAYARALGESGLLAPAMLVSHEQIAEAAPGRPALRFSVSTRWRVPAKVP